MAGMAPSARYLRTYRVYMNNMVKHAAQVGLFAVTLSIVQLVINWNSTPGWLYKIPCSFQSTLGDFAALMQTTTRVLEFGALLPGIGLIVYACWFLGPWQSRLPDATWEPVSTGIVAVLYVCKVLLPVVVFTGINFKLPQYVPYADMSRKACGATASLVFYPNLAEGGEVISESYAKLRDFYRSFISNKLNHRYPQYDFEGEMANLANASGARQDEEENCVGPTANSGGGLAELDSYFAPGKSIQTFCNEGFDVANRDLKLSLSDSMDFPLNVLSEQINSLFTAIPLAYSGCSRSMHDDAGMVVLRRGTPSASLSFEDLCQVFYSSETYADIPAVDAVKYASFFDAAEHAQFAAHIRALPSEPHRQIACMFTANLPDPRTGYHGAAGLLCPEWVAGIKSAKSNELAEQAKAATKAARETAQSAAFCADPSRFEPQQAAEATGNSEALCKGQNGTHRLKPIDQRCVAADTLKHISVCNDLRLVAPSVDWFEKVRDASSFTCADYQRVFPNIVNDTTGTPTSTQMIGMGESCCGGTPSQYEQQCVHSFCVEPSAFNASALTSIGTQAFEYTTRITCANAIIALAPRGLSHVDLLEKRQVDGSTNPSCPEQRDILVRNEDDAVSVWSRLAVDCCSGGLSIPERECNFTAKEVYDKSAMICKNPDDYDADGCNAFHGVGGVRWKIGSVGNTSSALVGGTGSQEVFIPLENGWKDFDSKNFLHCHGEQVLTARAARYPRYGNPDTARQACCRGKASVYDDCEPSETRESACNQVDKESVSCLDNIFEDDADGNNPCNAQQCAEDLKSEECDGVIRAHCDANPNTKGCELNETACNAKGCCSWWSDSNKCSDETIFFDKHKSSRSIMQWEGSW